MSAALVTGVSRTRGIAAAVAARLRTDGFTVVTSGWTPYDHEHHADIAEQVPGDLQYDLGDAVAAQQLLEAAERKAQRDIAAAAYALALRKDGPEEPP